MGRARLVVAVVLAVLLATFLAVVLLAILYLPWWAWLVIAALVVLLPLTVRLVVRWKVRSFLKELDAQTPPDVPPFFAAAFKMKGSVLRKARVVVHSVQRAEAPPPQPGAVQEGPTDLPLLDRPALPAPDADGAGEGVLPGQADPAAAPRDYYLLDVTIKPTRLGVGFKHWQPGELALTAPDSGWLDADDTCRVVSVEVEQGGAFGPESDLRYAGPQRLRLLIGVRPGTERLVFRYYTERLGEIVLPGA